MKALFGASYAGWTRGVGSIPFTAARPNTCPGLPLWLPSKCPFGLGVNPRPRAPNYHEGQR